jgi:hypothetical protein
MKKTDEALIGYLTREEMQALLNAPDPRTIGVARTQAVLGTSLPRSLFSNQCPFRVQSLPGACIQAGCQVRSGPKADLTPMP